MEVKIIDYDDLGNGITRITNKICFVDKALPGEIVKIKILKDNKKYSRAIITDFIKESQERIKPICPYYGKCGGCNFLHLNKQEEKKFKIKRCEKFFTKCNDFYETKIYNYRNKVKLHVKNGILGFFKVKSNDLVPIDYCYLLNDNINKVIDILNSYKDINFNGIVVIRENKSQEILLIIDGDYQFINILKDNDLITNLIYNNKVIKGKDYFIENILDYKFKVSYNSFFQVNRLGLTRIYQILSNFLKDKNITKALDLYSGTSVLGIHLARYVNKVISIEINKSATDDAKFNSNLNKINNLEVINGRVEDYIDTFSSVDLIILDPARSGLDKKTISYLNTIKSKYIIYIACSIDSLKRDLKQLINYNLDNLYLVDMFPRTNNVECVSIFSLKDTKV